MNTAFVPSSQDAALTLESAVGRTANYNGNVLDMGFGFSPGACGMPVGAVVQVFSMSTVNGDESYLFKLQESDDLTTWYDASCPVAAASANPMFTVPGFISRRWVRLALAIGGTAPSIMYSAWLNPNVCP
ncbi:MAG TPA: hypothetical protein VM008_17335 [Phycisphaerae bacterium]|nr:hypothetical protein [Phycisphaerae bacterium]